MYEEPRLQILYLTEHDVVARSPEKWEDDNVDDNGWT